MQLSLVGASQTFCGGRTDDCQEIENSELAPFFDRYAFKLDHSMQLIVKDMGPLLDLSTRQSTTLIEKYLQSYGKLEKLKSALDLLQIQLEKLAERKKESEGEISELENIILETKEKIAEEEKWRTYAWEDLIPGLGFMEKIKGQNPKRAIPFYSSMLGVISIATQALESAQRTLDLKMSEKRQLSSQHRDIQINFTNKEKEAKRSKINTYAMISRNIQVLIDLIDCFLSQCEVKEKNLNEELCNIVKEYNLAHQNQEKLKSQITSLKNELERLNNHKQKLNNEINGVKNSISIIKDKIEEEEDIRTFAWTDLIPGVGLIGGLVTKRYERIIPFYSSVRGIVSIAEQTVETEQRKLNLKKEEKKELKLKKKEIEASIKNKNDKNIQNISNLAQINLKKSAKDAEIAEFGKALTRLRNASSFLKSNLHKYKCVEGEVEGKPLLIELDIFEENEMLYLIEELKNIKSTLSLLLSE